MKKLLYNKKFITISSYFSLIVKLMIWTIIPYSLILIFTLMMEKYYPLNAEIIRITLNMILVIRLIDYFTKCEKFLKIIKQMLK